MTLLLERFTPRQTAFRPQTATELFSLRLAQKLDDVAAVRHYVSLSGTYSQGQLLCAYRRALRHRGNGDLGRQFQSELGRVRANGSQNGYTRLISIRIERRAVAAAIFHDEHLEYADSRQLSSMHDRALSSALGFIVWLLNRFQVDSAALEAIPEGKAFQRRVLHDAVCDMLRDQLLPIWQIPKIVLLEGCGYPPLRSRDELRGIATAIWPILAGSRAKLFIQDAAILGLHVQTERLFIIN